MKYDVFNINYFHRMLSFQGDVAVSFAIVISKPKYHN